MFVPFPLIHNSENIDWFLQGLGDLNRAIGWYFKILEVDNK